MHEILTNPLVIAAVIGIISAIFGKKNKDEKRPPGTRPENQTKKQDQKQPQKEHKPEAEELPAVSEENPFEKKEGKLKSAWRRRSRCLTGLNIS